MVMGDPKVEGQLMSDVEVVEVVGGVSGLSGRARLRDWPFDKMVSTLQIDWVQMPIPMNGGRY